MFAATSIEINTLAESETNQEINFQGQNLLRSKFSSEKLKVRHYFFPFAKIAETSLII